MKLTNKLMSKVGADKVLHFLAGALVVAQFEIFAWRWLLIALAIVAALSVIKEKMYDKPDWMDVVAAMCGAFAEILSFVVRAYII